MTTTPTTASRDEADREVDAARDQVKQAVLRDPLSKALVRARLAAIKRSETSAGGTTAPTADQAPHELLDQLINEEVQRQR